MDDEQEDEPSDTPRLLEVASRLRDGRLELHMTIYALEHGRRTPAQRQALRDRSRRLLRRSALLRRRINEHRAIH